MKKKVIAIVIWIALTSLYIFTIWDSGRSIGAQANSAIEDCAKYYATDYAGAQGVAEKATNAWSYSYFGNLSERYKSTFLILGVSNVIYILATVTCVHIVFKKKNN